MLTLLRLFCCLLSAGPENVDELTADQMKARIRAADTLRLAWPLSAPAVFAGCYSPHAFTRRVCLSILGRHLPRLGDVEGYDSNGGLHNLVAHPEALGWMFLKTPAQVREFSRSATPEQARACVAIARLFHQAKPWLAWESPTAFDAHRTLWEGPFGYFAEFDRANRR